MSNAEYEVVLVAEGHPHEYRGRNSYQKRTVQIDRVWEVRRGEEVVGTITYEMLTRETRSKGKVYVNSRWYAPGYRYAMGNKRYGWRPEAHSKKYAIERIIENDRAARRDAGA